MKNTIALLLSAVTLANCQDQESHSARFTVQVKDDTGAPIADYTVSASHFDMNKRNNTDGDSWTGETRQSDKMGKATFEFGLWTNEIGLNFQANTPPQYYPTIAPIYQFQRVDNDHWVPDNPLIEVVLKRKLKPIPMYARRMGMGKRGDVPELGKEFGFDLQAADWVAPHGRGKTADMFFLLEQRYAGPVDFDGKLRVRFPNKGDGLIAAPAPTNIGSELRLAYQCPLNGYVVAIDFRNSVIPPADRISTNTRRDMNYYMRTRTVLDATGKVKSALYGKIHGDFGFDVTGTRKIGFAYFLNPTPNDRNVEFDTKRNLFTDLEIGEGINEP